MALVQAVAVSVAAFGWLTFAAMMLRSRYLAFVIFAQWQIIAPETEEELRAQGMPHFDGLPDEWWWQFSLSLPHVLVTKALVTKTVHTDDALAYAIRRYRQTRRIATVAFCATAVAFAAIVIRSQ